MRSASANRRSGALDERFLEERFGKWGLALAGKVAGLDAGGWFDGEIGDGGDPKSISHEHTFYEDTADAAALESDAGAPCRRWWAAGCGNTVCTRVPSSSNCATRIFPPSPARAFVERPTQIDTEIFDEVRALFLKAWKRGERSAWWGFMPRVRTGEGQMNLLDEGKHERWQQALTAVDKMRDKYGDAAVSLAAGTEGHVSANVRPRGAASIRRPKSPPPRRG